MPLQHKDYSELKIERDIEGKQIQQILTKSPFVQRRFIITLVRKNINYWQEPTVCTEFTSSPHVCVGFLWVLPFPPASQR